MTKITKTNKVRSEIRPDLYSFSIETRYNNLKISFFFLVPVWSFFPIWTSEACSRPHLQMSFKWVKEQPNEIFLLILLRASKEVIRVTKIADN